MATFGSVIAPLIGGAVVIYAIYLAFQSLYDSQNMLIMESIKFIGSLALCCFLAFNTSWYLSHIVPFVYHSGDTIAGSILGGGSSGGSALQAMFDDMFVKIETLFKSIDFEITSSKSWVDTILKLTMVILVCMGYLPFIGIATAYLIVAKVMVGFLLIIGSLFIMFAFFPSTRNMFMAWTGQCLNYILLSILYPLAFTMFDSTIEHVLSSGSITLVECFFTVILFAVCILISVQIPTFCSSLTGGVGINGLVSHIGQGAMLSAQSAKLGALGLKGAWNKGKSLAHKSKNNITPG